MRVLRSKCDLTDSPDNGVTIDEWNDPRSDPSPPYRGRERPLARAETELAGLIGACKEGRFYDVEKWVAAGRPLQVDLATRPRATRVASPLATAIAAGSFDLVRLLLCNGYQTELEARSPLDPALEARRWDLLGLLLDWGADPMRVDVWRVLDTYQREVFERFWAAGVDLTAGDAMARAFVSSTRNRPLYGFAKTHRNSDGRIQRALDIGLGVAVKERSDKAISLCMWAGADPRHRVSEIGGGPEDDQDGMTAFEQAVADDNPEYLSKLRFDAASDDLEGLYQYVYGLNSLRALVAIRPPADWTNITVRFLDRLAFSVRMSVYMTSVSEVESVFALGGRLEHLERHIRKDLRGLLLSLSEWDAKRLFRLLSNPENLDRKAFIELVADRKLAERYTRWSWQHGVDKRLLAELVAASGVPRSVKELAKEGIAPPRRVVTQCYFEEAGSQRLMSREELYELVWAEPLLGLSRRFGLSDNGLRKRCRAMNVPIPPQGYWQRARAGRYGRRLPLARWSE